jgi:WD40 repeat protein
VTGKVVAGFFKGHTKSISFSPNGKHIASCSSDDHTIRVWGIRKDDLLAGPLIGHTNLVTAVAFSADGNLLASGSEDKTIRIWNVRGTLWKSGNLMQGPLVGHKDRIYFVAFSPDAKSIISASSNGDVCVFDTKTGTLVSGPSKQHPEGTLAVAFTPNSTCCAVSPDGKWIAIRGKGEAHKAIQVWDSKTGLLAVTFIKHSRNINSITFSPDSKRIVSSSADMTVRVHTLS